MRYQMLKRDIRLFLRCLLPATVLTAVFAAVCAVAALAAINNAKDVYTPVKAAVVDREDSVFNRMLIRTVAKTDYMAELLEITYCDMDEAMEGMESGDLSAVIVLPEGAFEGITSGIPTKGEIYLSSSVAAYADIVQNVAAFGELLLAAGQYGVFSGQYLIWDYDLSDQFQSEFLAQSNTLLLGDAIGATSSYFDVQVLDYTGTGMSPEGYYLVSWTALLILLLPLFFVRLYTGDLKKAMLCRLRGCGMSDGDFLLGKVLYPAAFQMVIIGAIVLSVRNQIAPSADVLSLVCAAAAILIAAILCCFLLMLGSRGVPVLIVLALSGLLLCGGVIPRQMLPDVFLTVGSITPYGAVQNLLMPLWGGRCSWLSCGAGLVYAGAAAVAAYLRLQHIRIGGDEE